MTRKRRHSTKRTVAATRQSTSSKQSDAEPTEQLPTQEEKPEEESQENDAEDTDDDNDDDDSISYQEQFVTGLMKLHSTVWDPLFSASLRSNRTITDFATDIVKLRNDYFDCCICHELVSDEPLLCKSPTIKHGPVCKECIVRHNGCNCGNQDCNLGLTDFADSASFTLTVLSFKKFCYFFMRSADCIRMVEIKVASDDDFDGIDLIKIISDGAMKGLASLKKSLMLEEEACGGLADDLSSHSDDLEPTHSECTESPDTKKAEKKSSAKSKSKNNSNSPKPSSSGAKSADKKDPVPIQLPPCKKWVAGNKVFTYNAGNPAQSTGIFSLTPCGGESSQALAAAISSTSLEVPSTSSGSSKGSQKKKKEPESQPRKSKSPTKKDEHIKPIKPCRCGNAAANPGKLTCCGQRCPCYVDGRSCVDCKCKGCRNPHLPGGKKILQGINAVIDTATNETVPLHLPYITAQFFSNPSGQMMQSLFPLAASVASFNPFSIPVLSVSPIVQHQQQQQP